MPRCKNLAFCNQSVMRYRYGYALMTQYKSFLTLRTKSFLKGFLWSHLSITVVISRPQFAHQHVDFWQGYNFSLDRSDISTNHISSQILIFVTSHFTTQEGLVALKHVIFFLLKTHCQRTSVRLALNVCISNQNPQWDDLQILRTSRTTFQSETSTLHTTHKLFKSPVKEWECYPRFPAFLSSILNFWTNIHS